MIFFLKMLSASQGVKLNNIQNKITDPALIPQRVRRLSGNFNLTYHCNPEEK